MSDASSRRDDSVKGLLKQYIDEGLSRRQFLSALAGAGVSIAAADSLAADFDPFVRRPGNLQVPVTSPSWTQSIKATGGALLVAQLKAAGQPYIFVNPSSGAYGVFDALVDEPGVQIIQSVHEGALAAMADGYARASGKTPFVLIARPGLPNAMTQMYNAWKDHIPMVVCIDVPPVRALGQDHFEEVDHMDEMTQPITKWHWTVETTGKIPEMLRRAIAFASTRPGGPTFLAIPENLLGEAADSAIMDQGKFTAPTKIAPDPADIERAAKLLLKAENPLLFVGDEVTHSGAEAETLELAELLGLPVNVGQVLPLTWSKPFPTQHPLYLGPYQPTARHPGRVDVMLNLGSRMPYPGVALPIESSTQLIQVRLDGTHLTRNYPTEVPIVADAKVAATALIEAVRRSAKGGELRRIADTRRERTSAHTARMREFRRKIAQERWNVRPISIERLVMEMDATLERDTCIVAEVDSAITAVDYLMTFGAGDKRFFSNTGAALGWGLPAAFGVKLALPDRPVVALVTDGGFLFAGPQPLWSYARYKAPVTVVVINNRSYNNERNRIWTARGRQFQTGRDMVCYLGEPDVDYVKLAGGFGVEGEKVEDPEAIRGALQRAMRANVEGRPYLLDVIIERRGSGAQSSWHPEFSIAAQRQKRV